MSEFAFSPEAAAKGSSEIRQIAGKIDEIAQEAIDIIRAINSVWQCGAATDILGTFAQLPEELNSGPVLALALHLEGSKGNYLTAEDNNKDSLGQILSGFS